jgi:hypothetical protein
MKLILIGLIALSQNLLYNVKTGADTRPQIDSLANSMPAMLSDELTSEDEKLTFWLNVYNAFIQIKLKENSELYTNRSHFFKTKSIVIAGQKLSLDDIEHGLLRHSKTKLSLGYFNKWFPGKFEKTLRLKAVDYRIHFALNCGAASCPPIAFYKPDVIESQLNLATKNYLIQEVVVDSVKNTVTVPKLMLWFKADFGGKKGVIKILKGQGLLSASAKPKIKYKDYNWGLELNKFAE